MVLIYFYFYCRNIWRGWELTPEVPMDVLHTWATGPATRPWTTTSRLCTTGWRGTTSGTPRPPPPPCPTVTRWCPATTRCTPPGRAIRCLWQDLFPGNYHPIVSFVLLQQDRNVLNAIDIFRAEQSLVRLAHNLFAASTHWCLVAQNVRLTFDHCN